MQQHERPPAAAVLVAQHGAVLQRHLGHARLQQLGAATVACEHSCTAPSSTPDDPNYRSGDDIDLEFVGHRFGFSADDFAERVAAAAVRLELVEPGRSGRRGERRPDGAGDSPAASPRRPRSALGRDLQRRWDEVAVLRGESLVYWLRKLVFRSAWLDHRVKLGLLDVRYDERAADFRYGRPGAERPLVEVAGHPSWHAVGFRGGDDRSSR